MKLLGGLALVASVGMFVIGTNSGHLSELADFCWVPLPIAFFAFWRASTAKSKG